MLSARTQEQARAGNQVESGGPTSTMGCNYCWARSTPKPNQSPSPSTRRQPPYNLFDQGVESSPLGWTARAASVRGTQKGTQLPRQITYVEGTHRTRINLISKSTE